VFHIRDHISFMKGIPLEGECEGIESFRDGLIVGFQSPTPRVEILSEEGAVLNTSNTSGGQLFKNPSYITVDKTTETTRILVSDRSKRTVYMLDDGLQLLQAFQLPSDGKPWSLEAVGGGQVLVVDRATHTLQLLDLTTGQWQTLLGKEDGLKRPYSLVYNQAIKLLYVGGWGGEVKVYTVSE